MSKTYKKSQNKNSMATFFKVLRFIGKYRFLLVLSVILAAVTVILQLYVPILFGDAIDNIIAAGQVDFARVGYYLKRVLVLASLSGVTGWTMSILNNRMTYRVVQDKASVLLTYESTTGEQRYREIPVFHTYGKGLVKDVLKGI